jgi:hypothetical protein
MEKEAPSRAYVKLGEGVSLFSLAHLDRHDPLAHHSGWLHSAGCVGRHDEVVRDLGHQIEERAHKHLRTVGAFRSPEGV